jgi:hypothetical protein
MVVVVVEEVDRMLFGYRGWELMFLGDGIDVNVLLSWCGSYWLEY